MKQHRISHFLSLAIVGLLLMSLAACGQPPEEEMTAARRAVQEAEADADVEEYAPRSLEEAKQLLDRMESASENRDYDEARSLAGQAQDAAEAAIADAANAKERAAESARTAVAAVIDALDEARGALEDAQDVPGISLDIPGAGRDLDAQGRVLSAAETDIQNERYAAAEAAAEDARGAIADVVRRISTAVRAASRK